MITVEKEEVAKIWFEEYFTKGNLEVLDQLTASNFIYHSRSKDSTKEDMKEFMKWYKNVFHDDEWTIEDLIEQDDQLVVRYTGWMTYKGGWFNIPSTNQRIKETGIIIFKFKEGQITELWCENSDAAILYELGALPKNTHQAF